MARQVRNTVTELERGREAYATRAWLDAYESLTAAEGRGALDAPDARLVSIAALMLGRDDESVVWLERAHQRYLDGGETLRAINCAAWVGLNLAARGEIGPASGWLGRAQRLLGNEGECAERGYLLLPVMFQHEAAGDYAAAAVAAGEAVRIGERFGDRDLFALAIHAQGQMLIKGGRAREGLALLDEAMVAVTAEELLPFVKGLVYCGVILACGEVYEVQRAREWTKALSDWWALQPEMVAFTGRCLVHRAEILQLDGLWPDALEEVGRAVERFVETKNPAAGLARYRQGELLRLQGDFAAAEEAYREASRLGWEPQPGLAQLRLAQGRRDAAAATIRRAEAATTLPVERARLLPAFVEIMLAAGQTESARVACAELQDLAGDYDSAMLTALVAHAQAAVHLAEGDARAALVPLRRARETWQALDAPYEIARTRVLAGETCRALGDEEAAALELDAAREMFERLGAKPDLERLDEQPTTTGHGLSARELEVLRLVASGKTNREIAASLVISQHTVARHVQNIFTKLRVNSRAAATAFAFEHDLV
ncbi:MAG TPA: LuxR C-terminal-related transcriptional regulator [Thermoleophilaceae bacterium]|nr:LuxR C-terminal-related transcriptional regulator [Thermoleophilaceae bacterium]